MGKITISFLASFIVYLAYYVLICDSLSTSDGKATNTLEAIPEDVSNLKNSWSRFINKKPNRPIFVLSAYRRDRINPSELEFIDDPDLIDKRSNFDDYGHLRFGKRQDGKRNQDWEDYGHMRFGR